jgi:hypothetical protein
VNRNPESAEKPSQVKETNLIPQEELQESKSRPKAKGKSS